MNQEEKQKWIDAGGPELQHTFRGITPNSIVFDIGLFKGAWSSRIVEKYNPYVFGFEPVRAFYESASRVLVKCPKVQLFNYGLGSHSRSEFIYTNQDSTSFIKESGYCEMAYIRAIDEFILGYNIEVVDLASINIEGSEYELLQAMLDKNLMSLFRKLLIQFHNIGTCPEAQRKAIREDMALTHSQVYSYDTVWDYWELL